tara:strand:+ start:679 stop:786 length:108 start_codon:yes stop_codon:yes gene_type:complete
MFGMLIELKFEGQKYPFLTGITINKPLNPVVFREI